MDRTAPAPPQNRDLVYCHQCENEWYRDEHGMTPCPECGGDFTEVIEDGNDPRDVPDPEEDDIGQFQWRNNPGNPGQLHGTLNINSLGGLQQAQQGGGLGGGIFSRLIGGALQSALGGVQARTAQQQQGTDRSQDAQAQGEQPPGVYVRHSEGPGYSYTIRSNVSLTPRNANGPQPTQNQPDDLDRLMANMLANIGAHPRGQGNFRFGAPPFGEDDADFDPANAGPFANMFRMFGMPLGGIHGDAVYSQEALDRVITQMMEQNASGNAPGPASQQAIDSLPKKNISQSDLDEQGKAECTICMEDVPVGEEVTVLPCTHWFHFDCIKMWLAEHDTCPHCRRGIMPRDQSSNENARSPNQAPLNDVHSPQYQARSIPGGFPFPDPNNASGAAEGSQENPVPIPESPQQERQSSGGGMFARMRDTFGGGSPGDGRSR